MIHWLLKG